MKKLALISILAIYVVTAFNAFAQEPDLSNETITWNSTGLDDSNNEYVEYNSTLITSPASVIWRQTDSDQEFEVTSQVWNWSDGAGTITYQVFFQGFSGSVTISGSGTEITAEIQLSGDSGSFHYSLYLSDYTY